MFKLVILFCNLYAVDSLAQRNHFEGIVTAVGILKAKKHGFLHNLATNKPYIRARNLLGVCMNTS